MGVQADQSLRWVKSLFPFITKTRPCNIQQYFTAVKMFIFRRNFLIFFLFLLKTLIVGSEAVLTSTHNQCFGAKIRKIVYPCKPQFYYIKVGCKGVFVTRTCFRDVNCHTAAQF